MKNVIMSDHNCEAYTTSSNALLCMKKNTGLNQRLFYVAATMAAAMALLFFAACGDGKDTPPPAAEDIYKKPEFDSLFRDLIALERAMSAIDWDISVGDVPPEDMEEKSQEYARLSAEYQSLFTSETMRVFFAAVEEAGNNADDVSKGIYRKAKRDFDKLACIPPDEYEAFSTLQQVIAPSKWEEAKEKSDFSIFSPYLEQLIEYRKKFIGYRLRAADFSEINAWLTEKIHRHGSLLSPDEILSQITDEGFSPRYYIEYLTEKYEALYGL